MTNVFDDFVADLDPVEFIERKLVLEGKQFSYTSNGRDFAKEIIYHSCQRLKYDKASRPVCVLKGRQVGLSTLVAGISLYFMYSENHKAFLHVFPEINQADQYSKRALINLIQESAETGKLPPDFVNKQGTQNQDHKDFYNRNTLYVKASSVDGRRLRGLTIQGIPIFDEFAQMTETAFRNVMECASNSKFFYEAEVDETQNKIANGSVTPHIVFGTPTSEEGLFHKIWRTSNKKEFFFTCPHCGNESSLFYEVVSRDEVFTNLETGTMIKCLNKFDRSGCGKLFDKNAEMPKGKWKSTLPPTGKRSGKQADHYKVTQEDYDYEGFYVPQFLRGNVTREEIDNKYKTMPLKEFYNEVLGQFYSFQQDALTRSDIIRLTTTNPDTTTWSLPAHYLERGTFMGIDWGARSSDEDRGTRSFTTCCILSLENTAGMRGQLKLIHASKLSEKDTDKQIERINELMRRYNVIKCVADAGFGKTEREQLTKMHGSERFSGCWWSGTAKRAFSYNDKENVVTANKHTILEYFFEDLKQSKFCFPYDEQSEEKLQWLLDHMCNIEVLNVERNGIITKEFHKKGGTEIDGLAGMAYAWTAYEFFKTKGFSMGPGQSITSGHANTPIVVRVGPLPGGGGLRNTRPRIIDKHWRGRR